jgi:hypothetical protein
MNYRALGRQSQQVRRHLYTMQNMILFIYKWVNLTYKTVTRQINDSLIAKLNRERKMSIWSTPKSAVNHAKQIKKHVDKCIHNPKNKESNDE